ncbi:PilN domain-containing protein [Roseateles oligotrophus]|uniref:PilN domain-containing protein n=1 Tax=Roseateles oligotrophus TaxID=1769250 RepID=A0ABT2YKI7_9BURK|nr:PilN domain-containing protein [Roseateles oligotrophus]MCV2370562.1 PilN domain-containing protein [Roseateles oligotrophus]
MNSKSYSFARLRRRLLARVAAPQALFLGADGVSQAGDAKSMAFADWCRAHAGAAAEITVSAQLLHELVCEPGLPLQDEGALQAYARQLFGHYFGAAAKSWAIATWRVNGGGESEQCGASALHGAAGAALQASARQFDVSLRRVQPAWAPLLRRLAEQQSDWFHAPKAALAWVDGQVLTWLLLQDGRPQSLRQLRLAAPTQAALADTLRELCAAGEPAHQAKIWVGGYGLDAGSLLASLGWPGLKAAGRLDGRGPELAWFDVPATTHKPALPQPDFLGARPPRSGLAAPMLGLGVLALLAGGWSAWDGREQLQRATIEHAQVQAELKQAATGAPKPPAPSAKAAPQQSADLEQQRSAAEVQALLRQPWEALLANVEQAGAEAASPGELSWLALDFNAARQELRLEGLAQDKSAALSLVDRLAAAPAWRDVVLSRFQNAEQGLVGQRFELSAKLRPSLLKLELAPLAASAPKDERP